MSDLRRKIELAQASRAETIDGYARNPEAEEIANTTCRAALNGPSGEALMDYLRAITTNVVLPVTATDAELRALEGQRRLVGILDARRRSTPNRS